MNALLTTPFTPISKNIASHRSAQGVIYADQIRSSGVNLDIAMSGNIPDDYNQYDELYVYHGNDWGGTLNMFGGVKEYNNIDEVIRLSKFKGKVNSINIPYPDYYNMLKPRIDSTEGSHPDWANVDWDNFLHIQSFAKIVYPNKMINSDDIAIGDSHAICMYRPGWQINSVPFKTLHGALKSGLQSFIPNGKFNSIEFYFGNIDIRHHLMRQDNPIDATKKLAIKYMRQASEVADKYNATVKVYELLPIENESRKLPKTGYYKGTPFYGSQSERNYLRLIFRDECEKYQAIGRHDYNVKVYRWVDHMMNDNCELDFEYMEKPKSVHLSRNSYPHWQGLDWNGIKSEMTNSLEDFFV